MITTNTCNYTDTVKKRIEQALKIEHLVAYKLHSRYRGNLLTAKQQCDVSEYLSSKDPSHVVTLSAFDAESSPFPQAYFNAGAIESVKPDIWWRGMRRYGVPDTFIDIAIQLLTSPASSASIERVFSSFGIVYSKARNRLGNDKAAKLVFCYCEGLYACRLYILMFHSYVVTS